MIHDDNTVEVEMLDSFTAVRLRDLVLMRLRAQAVAEALRVLVDAKSSFLERRAATLRAREALAEYDALPEGL